MIRVEVLTEKGIESIEIPSGATMEDIAALVGSLLTPRVTELDIETEVVKMEREHELDKYKKFPVVTRFRLEMLKSLDEVRSRRSTIQSLDQDEG